MDLSWGGYTNGLIPLSAMRYVASVGQYFEPDMADRVDTLVRLAATQGLTVRCQEGYRPLGSEPDQYITNETKTSTGGSNQWFQWGRYQRGETPSAGKPGTGSHGWGRAGDWTPGRENPIMLDLCTKLGLGFIIGSESWHAQVVATPSIPYKKNGKRKTMILVNNGAAEFVIGQEYIHHVSGPAEEATLVALLGDVVWKGGKEFDSILKAFGIPADKPAAVMGGKTWSLAHDTYSLVAPKTAPEPVSKPATKPAAKK